MADETLRNAAVEGAAANLEADFFAIQDGATSADQVSDQRLAPVYGAASGSAADIATLSFTSPAGSETVSHLGVWTDATGGTFRFAVALAGDLAFNAAGELDLTSAALTVADV
jgi:hypothetical protein